MNQNVLIERQQRDVWDAIDKRDKGMVELLIKEASIDIFTSLNPYWRYIGTMNAVMRAAYENLSDILDLLITSLPSTINIKNDRGSTALMWAVSRSNVDCVQLLINKGASIDLQDNEGETALMLSVSREVECAQSLIDSGANLNLKNIWGFTALSKAAMYSKSAFVELLIERGAALNLQNNLGATALMIAIFNRLDCAQGLIAKGADVELLENDGRSALDFAREGNHHELVKMLTKQLKWLSRRGFLMFLATHSYLSAAPPSLAHTMSRDELQAYDKQCCNHSCRPHTAVHRVFLTEELQRYIACFLGPKKSYSEEYYFREDEV